MKVICDKHLRKLTFVLKVLRCKLIEIQRLEILHDFLPCELASLPLKK